jgi:hypothetical protein
MKSTFKKKYARFLPLLAVGIVAAIGGAPAGRWRGDYEQLAQVADWHRRFTRPFTRQSACTIR